MTDWRPHATFSTLKSRAALLARIREFFADRGVLEVETPLLAPHTTTHAHIESVSVEVEGGSCYLQTSPEHAMKRLLCAHSAPIYQICKAFRAGEKGRRHGVEFTIVEWYRPGLDMAALMDEVGDLLVHTLSCGAPTRRSYRSAFEERTGLDPHDADVGQLEATYRSRGLASLDPRGLDRADWLDLLMAELVEPALGAAAPVMIYDYPVALAANARLRPGEPPVAERFEVYFRGMELGNGYRELGDSAEQRHRADRDQERRRTLGRSVPPIDTDLIAALESGLPDTSGVALGLDRLVMIATGAGSLREVVSFLEG